MVTLNNFYRSKKWERLIEVIKLERVNEDGEVICEHCGRAITKKYDCIGHHVIELDESNVNDPEIALNPENIKLVHFKCHNDIHQRFSGYKKQVWLVYGAPCSGKSTWVHMNANSDDLIVDVDRIWQCLCLSDIDYIKPKRLRTNVFAIRDELIEQVKMRKGLWRNAFIVGGYPLASDRDRLCELLGAKKIFVDENKDICITRARSQKKREYIEQWFDEFTG